MGGRRQYARALWDGWATPTSCVRRCEDGPQHAPLMLLVKVGSYINGVHTAQLRKGFSMWSGVKKKTTEKVMVTGRAHVLSGHDEVGGMDIPTELGGVEKVMVAASKEDSSSIDLRQQLILPATAREKLQDKDPRAPDRF